MYKMETILELYNIDELLEGTLPIPFNLINRYQQEDPFPTENIKFTNYQKGYFGGCRSTI